MGIRLPPGQSPGNTDCRDPLRGLAMTELPCAVIIEERYRKKSEFGETMIRRRLVPGQGQFSVGHEGKVFNFLASVLDFDTFGEYNRDLEKGNK